MLPFAALPQFATLFKGSALLQGGAALGAGFGANKLATSPGGIGGRLGASSNLGFGSLNTNAPNIFSPPVTATGAGTSSVKRDTGKDSADEAQRASLKQMRQISDTGFSDADRAAMKTSLAAVRANEKTANLNAKANLARRGMLNSGSAVLAGLTNAGQTANRLSQETANINAAGDVRRLEGSRGAADIAGAINAEKMREGMAADEMARFNANAMNVAAGQTASNITGAQTAQAQNQMLADRDNAQFWRPVYGNMVQSLTGWGGASAASRGIR